MVYGDLQFIDIIIFAGIAVFLIYRLRNVLGKRNGSEKKNITKENISDKNDTSDKEIPQDLIKQLIHGANEEDIIASGLEDTMRVAFQDMLETKGMYNLDSYRMAAYALALKKIEKSYLELGI